MAVFYVYERSKAELSTDRDDATFENLRVHALVTTFKSN